MTEEIFNKAIADFVSGSSEGMIVNCQMPDGDRIRFKAVLSNRWRIVLTIIVNDIRVYQAEITENEIEMFEMLRTKIFERDVEQRNRQRNKIVSKYFESPGKTGDPS